VVRDVPDEGEVPCDAAAAAAVCAEDDIDRGAALPFPAPGGEETWVVCLLGCCEDDIADGGCWRNAAKKVDRKKGRCVGMLTAMNLQKLQGRKGSGTARCGEVPLDSFEYMLGIGGLG